MGVNDEAWMTAAMDMACNASVEGEVPVGAVVVREDEVVGGGANRPIGDCDPTAHAEIIAMRRAGVRAGNYRLTNCTLYVTLEPCAMCLGAMLHARIARLVFGALDPKSGAVESVVRLLDCYPANHVIEVCGGVLADQSSQLLQEFFHARR